MTPTLGARLQAFDGRVRRYARDVANTLSAEIVSVASLSITFPVTIRGLGAELYGKYTVLYLVFGLAGLWVYAAPSAAAVQLVLQLEHDPRAVLRLGRRQMLVAVVPVSVGGTAICVAILGGGILAPALLVLGVDFLFTSVTNLNLAIVFSVDGVVRSARIRMLQPVLRAAGVGALALGDRITILTLVGVNVLASIAVLAVSSRAVCRCVPAGGHGTDLGARHLLRYSSYYATSMSTNAVEDEGEKFVLAATRPAAEIGQYAAAYRVVSMAFIPLSAVITAANRRFMKRDARPGAQLQRTARLSVPTAAYGIVAGIAIILGRGIVQWVAGSKFPDAGLMSTWLCLLPLVHGLAEIPPMGLLGLGRNRARVMMGFVNSAIALVAYLALVPTLGWRGGVIGTYISEGVGVVLGWYLLRRYQRRADG
ncbi:MAG: lipopolysaccharide biosynthesis protein [Ilumatobacteraceae bacterium]